MAEWSDRLAGARMAVDNQFEDRVRASQFSNQEWGLIMTAVEWEVRNPEDPDSARLAADTSNLPDIVPELDRIRDQMGAAGGPVGGDSESRGIGDRLLGFFDSLTGGTGDDAARIEAAESLVDEYARELQTFLEKRERWEDVRAAAAGEPSNVE